MLIDLTAETGNHSLMNPKQLSALLLSTLLFASLPAHAEITVLLHGLMGSSNSWERSGATTALEEMGWEQAGRVQPGGPTGVLLSEPLQPPRGNRLLYLADIPSLISLEQQSELLEEILIMIANKHPSEPIYLVGHSAGGVVSRMTAIQSQLPQLSGLITLASPHLGSPYANLAYDLATLPFPLRLLPKLVAHDKYQMLRKSRPMLKGLTVAKPGTLLHWLNQQPHPDIQYVSIIRRQPPAKVKDALVPFWSQDMNNIPALQGRALTISTMALHPITQADGHLLGSILNELVTHQR
jgi:pimeloyl-ACP methyl ester carboxylesterase